MEWMRLQMAGWIRKCQKAGLQNGDVVEEINGMNVHQSWKAKRNANK